MQEPKVPNFLPSNTTDGFELPRVPLPKVPDGSAPDSNNLCFKSIRFRGNTVVPSSALAALAEPFSHCPINAAQVEELRLQVTRYYIDKGYVNSGAVFKDGAMQGDTLTIDIVEGTLSSAQLNGLERLNPEYVLNRLDFAPGTPLNVNVLRERFSLLLEDPLIERMNARLMPGEHLGEAVLDLNIQRARPYQLTAIANNYRPPSVGSSTLSLSGWVKNLSGQGDTLDLTVQNSGTGGSGGRYSAGWRMPLNQRGTLLSMQFDHADSVVIEQPLDTLNIASVLTSADIGISQQFYESLSRKFSMGLNWVDRQNTTTLAGTPYSFSLGETDGYTRVTAWRFWQEYVQRTSTQVIAARSTFTMAQNNLHAPIGLPAGADIPDSAYTVWLGQMQFVQQVLDGNAQLVARATVQQSTQTLAALDRMSLGGVYTVRGYRENQLVLDKGLILNVELIYPWLSAIGKDLNVKLVPFLDIGVGRNQMDAADTFITSGGVAVRSSWNRLHMDLTLAKRLAHSSSVVSSGNTLQDNGIHLQMSYDFF